ncbi:MAG: (d)CMP kinase [Christensenellaceae bacterium]|jgi:cytidylate kinase
MIQIAIDGPAGAGKSTIAKALAEALNINYMDTGAMYRAMAYAMLARGIAPGDGARVIPALSQVDISISYEGDTQKVFIDGEDVTDKIRTPEISKGASDIGTIKEVRVKLADIQRKTAGEFPIVMDGREIGTYVLPEAPLKFYITASSRTRAERRQQDLKAMGIETELDALEAEIVARDEVDSNREFAPLRRAEDAIYLDTSELSIDEVVAFAMQKAKEVFSL